MLNVDLKKPNLDAVAAQLRTVVNASGGLLGQQVEEVELGTLEGEEWVPLTLKLFNRQWKDYETVAFRLPEEEFEVEKLEVEE